PTLLLQRTLMQQQYLWAMEDLKVTRRDLQRLRIAESLQSNREAGKSSVPDKVIEDLVDRDPGVEEKTRERKRIEALIADAKLAFVDAEKQPAVQIQMQKLQKLVADLEARRKELRPALAKELNSRADGELKMSAAAMREQIAYNEKLEKALMVDIENFE